MVVSADDSTGNPPGLTTLEPTWCAVPAGPFLMGSARSDPDAFDRERPQHVVWLGAYAMARYAVTNAQWGLFADIGGGCMPRNADDERFNAPDQPVVGVSWYEALAFARWLSDRLGYSVRLPTEAEWEKAGRGTDGRRYPFGDTLLPESIRAQRGGEGRAEGPWPVGRRPWRSSPYGVEDLVGNTYAWTTSRWGPTEAALDFPYPYRRDDGREDLDADDLRVVRGGAWRFPLRHARCTYRGKDRPDGAFDNLGVRLVRDISLEMNHGVGGATQ